MSDLRALKLQLNFLHIFTSGNFFIYFFLAILNISSDYLQFLLMNLLDLQILHYYILNFFSILKNYYSKIHILRFLKNINSKNIYYGSK